MKKEDKMSLMSMGSKLGLPESAPLRLKVRFGIITAGELLSALASPEGRPALADHLTLSEEEVRELIMQLEQLLGASISDYVPPKELPFPLGLNTSSTKSEGEEFQRQEEDDENSSHPEVD